MYKIKEIIKNPIKLSAWLDSKNEKLSLIYKSLLDDPSFKLQPNHLPTDSKVKPKVLTHLKMPEWSFEEKVSLTAHAIERGKQGAWIWPNVIRDIEALNPGVSLSREDAKATLTALGITIAGMKDFKAKSGADSFEKNPAVIVDSGIPLEEVLEFLFGNHRVTWATAIECISKLDPSTNAEQPHLPLAQGQAESPAKLVTPPLSKERHTLSETRWNHFTLARDFTAFNNQYMPNPKPPTPLDRLGKDAYDLTKEPDVYLDVLNKEPTSELERYIHSQGATNAPFDFDQPDEVTHASIRNFLAKHLSLKHFTNGKPSAILAGLQVKKNFDIWYDVKSYLYPNNQSS